MAKQSFGTWFVQTLKRFITGVRLILTGKFKEAWKHAGKK